MVSVYSPGRHGLRTKLSGLTAKGRKWRMNAGSDPVIKQRAISGPVPWVIAIMTALTVIAAAGGLALGSIASAAGDELQGGVTVQIAGPPEAIAAGQAEAVVALLSKDAKIRSLRRLGRDERADLVAPWMGDTGFEDGDADDNSLALPELVEVQLAGEASDETLGDLRTRIAKVAPDALVSADTSWLEPVGRAIEALQWLALSLVGLLAMATLAAVLLASRSALNANRQVIELMHLLGAQDRQVAELFQRAAAVGAGVGGAAGFAVALAVVSGLAGRFEALGPGESAAGLNLLHWLVLALIPIMATLLAALTARLTVLATLRRMV